MSVSFFVPGVPVPQGSKKGFVVKGRAVLVDVNKNELRAWRAAVADIARASAPRIPFDPEAGLAVAIVFAFVRPASSARAFPSVPPDIDKLARAVLDGLTQSGLIADDSRVVRLEVDEIYAPQPGARITVGYRADQEEGF